MFMMTICEFVKGNSNLDKEEEDKNGFGFQSPKVFLNWSKKRKTMIDLVFGIRNAHLAC